MPSVTGATLLAEVRDIADEPSDGDGTKAYATDTFIYRRLSDRLTRVLKQLVSVGFPVSLRTTDSSAAPGSSMLLSSTPLAILGVYLNTGTGRVRLPRLITNTLPPVLTGTATRCWQVSSTFGSAITINLYPSEDRYTIDVDYVGEPDPVSAVSTYYLPSSAKDAIVYGAALDCYAKRNAQNPTLERLYNEALIDAEATAAHYTAETVVRNTDDVYAPGYDQLWVDYFDYSTYVLP